MSESPEHAFLTEKFVEILEDFSKLKLYGFQETQRKRFDFSCLLERDWKRPLVGQTLWRHFKGMDKDIRLLITDRESEIKAYVARDTIRYRLLFEEIMNDFRKSGHDKELYKVKVFLIPPDFDADKEEQRAHILETMKSSIVQDILFNVVFGHITADDIAFFLDVSGIPGLNLVLLHEIASTRGFLNIADMSKRIEVSAGPIREKLLVLTGSGFLQRVPVALLYEVSPKGRLFIDLLGRLSQELEQQILSPELEYVLDKLGCHPVSLSEIQANQEVFPTRPYVHLVKTMSAAVEQWGIHLGLEYQGTR